MPAFFVELLGDTGRKRRYSTPLFLSPNGQIAAFPESADDCFPSLSAAKEAGESRLADKNFRVGRLFNLLQSSRYKSWHDKVKPCDGFKESRTSFLDSWEFYLQGGWHALRGKYTKAHALQLVKRFISEGLLDAKEEILERFSAVEAESPEFWELMPLIQRAEFLGVNEIHVSLPKQHVNSIGNGSRKLASKTKLAYCVGAHLNLTTCAR